MGVLLRLDRPRRLATKLSRWPPPSLSLAWLAWLLARRFIGGLALESQTKVPLPLPLRRWRSSLVARLARCEPVMESEALALGSEWSCFCLVCRE